ATGDSQYIDVMERGIYNNAIDGVASSGDRFFYVNRLASAGDGRDLRWQHASLECCPPNLVRFLASMSGLIYAQDQKGAVFVNLYVSSRASFVMGGKDVTLSIRSEMPWGGASTIAVAVNGDARGAIKLRIPGWARNRPAPGGLYSYVEPLDRQATVSINQTTVRAVPDADGYVTLDRVWRDGDIVSVEFPMAVRTVVADPRVKACAGRVAIERGPIVYCAEWPEAEGGRVADLVFAAEAGGVTASHDGPMHGPTFVHTRARRMGDPSAAFKPITLIPYHLWANRGAGEMTVWLPTRDYSVGDVGPAGGVIFYVNPTHAADGWRFLEAAPADESGGAKWGCFRTAVAGARGTAVGTGRQNTLDMLANCDEPATAAHLCANSRINGVAGWFLPSRDELALMHQHLAVNGLGDFYTGGKADNVSYWSSSQQDADMAAHIDFADSGRQHVDDKDFPRRVRAIRAF
ncbi:MAG TPA: beta-L-arabinofuranosidase domain-containing protein, partial [Vicinamibacterales bacterium]|nr:beta-L-arabinofuranosidase domain-containing protein [Vicinamibacterales bacterium]